MTRDTAYSPRDLAVRGLGVVVIAVALTVYRETLPLIATDLVLPAAFAVGAWLVLRNLAAVCLGSGLLALAHSNLGAANWITGIAYPLIAAGCFAVTVAIYGTRFRQHVRDTHDERWRSRR